MSMNLGRIESLLHEVSCLELCVLLRSCKKLCSDLQQSLPCLLQVDEFGKRRVWAILESGERYEGDILVGADGIWSKVGLCLRSWSHQPAACGGRPATQPGTPHPKQPCPQMLQIVIITVWAHLLCRCCMLARCINSAAPPWLRRSASSWWVTASPATASTPATQASPTSPHQTSTLSGTVCSWATGATLSAVMWAEARCSGMASTRSLQVRQEACKLSWNNTWCGCGARRGAA